VDEQDRQARRDQFAARRPDAFMAPARCDPDYYDRCFADGPHKPVAVGK
jgi:hypothetical protein